MNEDVNETEMPEDTGKNLTINDIASAVQIIDLCSTRGAFQGSELEAVGVLRGRLQAFVQAHKTEEQQQINNEQ